MPRLPKEDKLTPVLENLTALLVKLNERLEGLEAKKLEPIFETKATPPVEPERFDYPIPQEYREAVDTILNKQFGIHVIPMSDSPRFQFNIVVPDKYSPMTPAQKAVMHFDLRPRVIDYAEGLNGVKLWAERVFENFNPETRAQIVADRSII